MVHTPLFVGIPRVTLGWGIRDAASMLLIAAKIQVTTTMAKSR